MQVSFRWKMKKVLASSLILGVATAQSIFGLAQAASAAVGTYESQSLITTNATTQALTGERSFLFSGSTIDVSSGVRASVVVAPTTVAHAGEEVVLFQLMNGTTPIGITAVQKDITTAEKFTVHFNASGSNLSVKAYVVDSYSGSLTDVGNNLADPVTIKPVVKVQILGINDFHGQLDTTSNFGAGNVGGAVYLATHLKERKATNPNTLLVHNGDTVGASAPVSSLERDKPTMEFLDLLKFDVGTLGNHEFDQGVAALKAQINGGADPVKPSVVYAPSKVSYINANVIDTATNKPFLSPYVIKEVGGVKVGFIGVVTMATVSKVSPSALQGVKLVDQAPAVNQAVYELKAKGVKTIVVLAHDPASVDKSGTASGEAVDLAKAIDPEVDVIYAGDNHARVNTTVNGKLIVQAYSYGTAYADIDLEIDPATGDVVKKEAAVVDVKQAGVTPDPEVSSLINKYLDMHPELKVPVGYTDTVISRTYAYDQENALGNLIADAMRDEMKTDFAFMNPGGIRADLPKGAVVFSDLAKIQPFGNTLVKMDLTGAQIKTLLQQQWGTNADGSPNTKTLQISGLKYTADFSKPVTERVYGLAKADGTPITDTEVYSIVVNNFMAAGGDNYKVLLQGQNVVIGRTDLDAFYDYIVRTFNGGKITSVLEGRITNINKP